MRFSGALAVLFPLLGCGGGISTGPAQTGTWACHRECAHHRTLFAGDTLVGHAARKRIRESGYGSVFGAMAPLLEGAHVALLNAEAPITKEPRPADPANRFNYAAPAETAPVLAAQGFSALSLANNHGWDRGEQGVTDTQRHGAAAGLSVLGAGDERQAFAPWLVASPHGAIGIVAGHVGPGAPRARGEQAGIARLWRGDPRRLADAARAAGAEHLVAFVHWGQNYKPATTGQRRWARRFADAGFDLVVGHGAHTQQAVGRIDDTVILYSIGNFVFGTPGRFDRYPALPYGLIATAHLGPAGFEAVELRCVFVDNRKVRYRPRPCTAEQRAESFGALGGHAVTDGERAWVSW